MADEKKKVNTIKSIGKKVANNGNADDYVYTPIGADSENVDRPDGSTVEDSLIEIETEKVEIIPVESLPESEIKIYPYVYALIKPNESIGTLYEYRNERWIKYGNGSDGIWVGTKEQCVQDFDNIEKGTIVIIVNKKEDSGETHTHDYVCQITKEPTYSEKGSKTYTCFLCGESYTEEIPALIDSIKPAGAIRIGDNEYFTWKDNISFDTYYKDDQSITIEATDNETGVKEIAYYLANAAVSESSIGTVTWTPYTDPFTIQPNDNYIVYVKITDNADNVTYICSDGIVMDNIPPVFEGLEDGGTYPTGTVLTVEDGAVLTVNGEVVELTNGSYTFSEPMDNCRLSLSDRAGNVNAINVTVIDALANAYLDWEYTLDNDNKIIQLNKYIGNDTDVVVHNTYNISGVNYKTRLKSNTSYVQNGIFCNCEHITNIVFENDIDTSSLSGMNYMFCNCKSLTNITWGNFDTSNVQTMVSVFDSCSSLSDIDLSNFDTSNVVNMESMFCGCESLLNVDLLNFNTLKVKVMSIMFRSCVSIECLDISSFDTSNVEDMDGMFQTCFELKTIYVSRNKWIVSQANTYDMFYRCGTSEVTYVD